MRALPDPSGEVAAWIGYTAREIINDAGEVNADVIVMGCAGMARHRGLLEAALSKPVHFCLSAKVAEPLQEAGATDVRIAAQPDEAALLSLCV